MLSERSRGFNSAGVRVHWNGSFPCPSHWVLLRILLAAGDMSSATAVSLTFCMDREVEFLSAFTSFACSGPLKPVLKESLRVAFGTAASSPKRWLVG